MRILRWLAEALFVPIERAITAAIYPFCRLRDWLGWPGRVPILMYHQIGTRSSDLPSGRDRVSPERFESQIHAVLKAGYRVLSLADLIRGLRAGPADELRRAVVLTFDDGYRGQFAFAYPILRRNRLPATFFVTTGLVGTNRFFPHLLDTSAEGNSAARSPAWLPLSWDEMKEMAGHGVGIASHAVSHRSLGRLPPEEAELEVRRSKELLERRLGVRVDHFAYPFGSRAYGDFDPGIQDMLRRAGYRAACTAVVGRSGPGDDRLALRRIPMKDEDGPFRVRCKLAGAYDWVGCVKSLWQRLAPRRERVDAALPAGLDSELHCRR